LRTLRSGCLRHVGNTTWNTDRRRHEQSGDAPFGSCPGGRAPEWTAVARALADAAVDPESTGQSIARPSLLVSMARATLERGACSGRTKRHTWRAWTRHRKGGGRLALEQHRSILRARRTLCQHAQISWAAAPGAPLRFREWPGLSVSGRAQGKAVAGATSSLALPTPSSATPIL
jgi:hypothetical protein